MYEICAQAVGIAAMAFNILSFQMKTPGKVMLCQLIGSLLFAVNFFMLDAIVGAIMNLIGVIRAVIYLKKDRFRADHILWLVGFTLLYIVSYVLTFTVLGSEFTAKNAILEVLPVIGMLATTISYRLQSAKSIRAYGLVSSPAWLIYNIANVAIGAIVCEVLSLGSIVLGMWRYDRKRNGENA